MADNHSFDIKNFTAIQAQLLGIRSRNSTTEFVDEKPFIDAYKGLLDSIDRDGLPELVIDKEKFDDIILGEIMIIEGVEVTPNQSSKREFVCK